MTTLKNILFLFLGGTSALQADIKVSFPVDPVPVNEILIDQYHRQHGGNKVPVYIDGILVHYLTEGSYGDKIEKELFDQIKEGMTLKEIVSLLGPGSQNKNEGIGFFVWRSEGGRRLKVWPSDNLNRKGQYYIELDETNQRHKDVAALARKLISSIKVKDQKVSVTLTQDTYQAKAYRTKIYSVEDTFQKTEPLPRIDFRIIEIEGNVVHCDYFYQAAPEGLLRCTDTGILTLETAK